MDQNCKGILPVVHRVNMISITSKYEVPDKWGQTIIYHPAIRDRDL